MSRAFTPEQTRLWGVQHSGSEGSPPGDGELRVGAAGEGMGRCEQGRAEQEAQPLLLHLANFSKLNFSTLVQHDVSCLQYSNNSNHLMSFMTVSLSLSLSSSSASSSLRFSECLPSTRHEA